MRTTEDGTAPVSHWFAALGDRMPEPRSPLPGDLDVDVCIVGGGFTGLWTAHALRRADPALDVLVVERDVCGFGASGRNGGWLQGHLAGDPATWRARGGAAGAAAMQRAIVATLDEIECVVAEEGIGCDLDRGGTLTVAQSAVELARLRAAADRAREHGAWHDGDRWLEPDELTARIAIPGARGAWFSPDCARLQPARLVRGLAQAVERAGARIVEGTAATELRPAVRGRAVGDGRGRTGAPAVAVTDRGVVRARWVVRATEGYTATLRGQRRALAPINSAMVVTAPLERERWAAIGWRGGETVLDGGVLYHYLQRTADGRIAIGGRGVPYRCGSRSDREGPVPTRTVAQLRAGLRRLLGPAVDGVAIERAWHGVLGVPRDWTPAVAADPATGIAWAGGYVGEGVAASNLAGRTLADLLRGSDTPLTRLPWVLAPGAAPPRWEPEPLRWGGIRGVHALLAGGQAIERRRDRPSRLVALGERLAGR